MGLLPSKLRTFSMTLRAPPLFCRSAYQGATFIAGELISYAVDFSGDPGSCHLSRECVGCPVRATGPQIGTLHISALIRLSS